MFLPFYFQAPLSTRWFWSEHLLISVLSLRLEGTFAIWHYF